MVYLEQMVEFNRLFQIDCPGPTAPIHINYHCFPTASYWCRKYSHIEQHVYSNYAYFLLTKVITTEVNIRDDQKYLIYLNCAVLCTFFMQIGTLVKCFIDQIMRIIEEK